MANIVLVHGMTGGGWQFSQVARLLRRGGHEVYTVTLTGCGERVHLAHPDVDLDTHIADVVNLLRYEELQDVVLLGASYGGMVITGVAERASERLRELIYLDAVIPADGQSVCDKLAALGEQQLLDQIGRSPKAVAGASPAGDGDPRITAHPIKTLTQPLQLGNPAAAALPRTFIACTDKPDWGSGQALLEADARYARQQGWRYHELHTGHSPQMTHPNTLAELLLALIVDE